MVASSSGIDSIRRRSRASRSSPSLHSLEREDRRGAQRQEPDHRPHLEPCRDAVRQAQHVVEEPVLLVPQLVLVVADPVHRRGDEQEVLGELEHHVLVERVVLGELDRDPEHALREERHPRRAVRLLEVAAGRQRCTAVEHADVVQAEEPALEHVASGRILAVDPPREVHEQLLERALQPRHISLAALFELGLVHGQRRPGVHRRVDVAEVPLVRRQLPARVEVQLAEHQLELGLGVVDVDHRERDRVERQIPRRVPRVLPRVGHRDHVVVDHVEPVPVADVGGVRHCAKRVHVVLVEPTIEIEDVELLSPQHPGQGLAHDHRLVGRGRGRRDRRVELVGIGDARSRTRGRPRRRSSAGASGPAQPELHDADAAGGDVEHVVRGRLRAGARRVDGAVVPVHHVLVEGVLHVRRRVRRRPTTAPCSSRSR